MRKKILILAIAIICIVLALTAYSQFAFQAQIAVNDTVYTQKGPVVTELPAGSVKLGFLESISHKTTYSPSVNFSGTNLDAKYAGCPIYQWGDVIYLEDFSGFYIPFE